MVLLLQSWLVLTAGLLSLLVVVISVQTLARLLRTLAQGQTPAAQRPTLQLVR